MATPAVVSATPHRQYLLLAIKELSALTALQFFGKAGRKAAGRPAASLSFCSLLYDREIAGCFERQVKTWVACTESTGKFTELYASVS